MSKQSPSPAVLLNWGLYGAIVLLVAIAGFGIYFAQSKLSTYVTEVDHLKIDADLNEQAITNAKRLQKTLDENQDSVQRAAAIVADTKYYEYQDQIVSDINSYAAASGLTVLGFDFSSSAAPTPSKISGLKTVLGTVTLKNPVQYSNYLKFLKLIERNLTKMQVSELAITSDLKTNGSINTPTVSVEVYVR